ncbi:MAG: translation initiation factor IF-5A [Candidatus Woesearchaeota archaeon]
MGEIKKIQATSVKKGTSIIIDGIACTVKDVQTSKPGKHGHAKCRIEAIGMIDSNKKIIVVPGHEKLDSPIIEKKSAQILSIHGDTANVMDSESYETFDLKIPAELKDKIKENAQVLYWIIMDIKVMKEIK